MNRSPWLHQLERTRPLYRLDHHRCEELVIVGGGIAGVMTAAFTLHRTKQSVLLLEATRLAHGATGHNAGQIVSYFERQLPDLAKQFGKYKAGAGLQAIESAWDLLDSLKTNLDLKTPVYSFPGYVGFREQAALDMFLATARLRHELHLSIHPLYLAEEALPSLRITPEDRAFFTAVPRARLHNLLETSDHDFIGVQSSRKGVTNSAALTEELASTLLTRFPERFTILEETPVHEIRFSSEHVAIKTKFPFTLDAQRVALCTNGFESFHVYGHDGARLDQKFHASVHGIVGYMVGYEDKHASPTAISYLERAYQEESAYAYMTRRPFSHGSLVCWGGPEKALMESDLYHRTTPIPEAPLRELKTTIANLRSQDARKSLRFRWHGLMGYTKSGVRMVGPDTQEPRLLYNLGCNGVGILPSIYGGFRLAQHLNNERLEPSLFDPS